ncbi:MAG: transposase [Deltaproteobacteria bacterium]|nr:transposase [Deltaproteobacteria bacterium]
MARPRIRHVQQELLDSTGTKPKSRRGGKRRGAGRPPKGERAGSPHKKRPSFKSSQPLHIVLRVLPVMGQLRRRSVFRALRQASLTVATREDFRIVHISIQQNHVHLLVEAQNKTALSRGMKAFEISAAKRMNAALKWKVRRRGKVFEDRYHSEIIGTPRQARHALAYVLNNWRKHKQDRGAVERTWMVDPFSTATAFLGWKQLQGQSGGWKVRETYEPMVVWEPRTWLLKVGWRKHGLLDCYEVPGMNLLARIQRVRL